MKGFGKTFFQKVFPSILPLSPSLQTCSQANEEGSVVGLCFCLVGGAITADLTAFGAAVDDDVAAFCIRLGADGLHLTAAGIGAVTGIDVDVERPQAERAVVARGISKRQDLFAAMLTDESIIVFGKSFLLH